MILKLKLNFVMILDNFLNISEVFQSININLGPQLRADLWKRLTIIMGK